MTAGLSTRGQASARVRPGLAAGAVVVGAVVGAWGVTHPHVEPTAGGRAVVLGVLFTLFAGRLAHSMVRQPDRRGPLAVVLTGLALWCAGALVISAHDVRTISQFPTLAEICILLAYVAFAGYVLLDAGVTGPRSLASWLNVIVICGGTACLSSAVLLVPASGQTGGATVTVALVLPIFDVLLAMLVIAQVVLGARLGFGRALPLAGAFLLFAVADTHFTSNLASGELTMRLLNTAAWGTGFALLISDTSRSGGARLYRPVPIGSAVVGAATAIAIFTLALRPAGALGLHLAVPAVLTLLATGGRLAVALREARRSAEALVRSHTDDLTGLPNRRALRERIEWSIARGTDFVLVMLDLDGFKDINETLGQAAGDRVLERVAQRIRETIPAFASVARLGSDEFAILTPRGDVVLMTQTTRDVLDVLGEPLHVDGLDITLSAAVGVVEWDGNDPIDSNELLRRAEVAMSRAKGGRQPVAPYDPLHDDFSKPSLRISEELRRGIADGELEVWYQPQIDASTLRPCALEALVRWRHPREGLLSPAAFLPAARRAGLMPLLSQAVVRLAVADVARWQAAGLRLPVAVNCAPPELLSGVFIPRLYEAIAEGALPPDSIVLEVTEDSFIGEPERAREILQDVREWGIQIAIDDYGTGFSSLAYLRDLPVDELKLDRSFVSAMVTDERSRMIVASTVQMAKALGLRTVAEGVEDAPTAAALIALGVAALQGYHISRPMPADKVGEWIVGWPSFADVRLTVDAGHGRDLAKP